VYTGLVLTDRYQIIGELGHGGFGRTYLAEDTNRFNERCVLKEFAPQVEGATALQKAEELFEREAGVLYKLQHPQIPRFRELFRANLQGKDSLFLVQDYVEGHTYHALLNDRKLQRTRFEEWEVTQLLLQILPVLSYIHAAGVIHRDIAPDNLIQRQVDGLPVLIDFGGVKHIAAVVSSQVHPLLPPGAVTRLGKAGYAPDEQMQKGVVFPHSDLYALAVTALVLLTGKDPQELLDTFTMNWMWRQEVQLSPTLGMVLDRMLARLPSDRYQSAEEVLTALHQAGNFVGSALAQPAVSYTSPLPTIPIASPFSSASGPVPRGTLPTATVAAAPPVPPRRLGGWLRAVLSLLLLAGLGSLGGWGMWLWMKSKPPSLPSKTPNVVVSQPTSPSSQYSAEEQARKERLRQRQQALGIRDSFYISLVNQAFFDRHPDQQGRTLSSAPQDAELRADWDEMAANLLDKLEGLSAAQRSQLGNYTPADITRWKAAVNTLHLSSAALFDLADGQFFRLFPEQRGQAFLDRPVGQIWQAIAASELDEIQSGVALEMIQFDPGMNLKRVKGTLKPGEGKAYIALLKQNQEVQVNLDAPEKSTSFSVYPPKPPPSILEDSPKLQWAGKLNQAGYYEFVVVSTASEEIEYELEVVANE
jgi:serine/threonine-protein kinase